MYEIRGLKTPKRCHFRGIKAPKSTRDSISTDSDCWQVSVVDPVDELHEGHLLQINPLAAKIPYFLIPPTFILQKHLKNMFNRLCD